MISFLRFILFVALLYYLFKWIRNWMVRDEGEKRSRVQRQAPPKAASPPYDPDKVEDIDYKEVKKKNNRR